MNFMVGKDKCEEQQTFGSFRNFSFQKICRKHPAEIKHRGVFEFFWGKITKSFLPFTPLELGYENGEGTGNNFILMRHWCSLIMVYWVASAILTRNSNQSLETEGLSYPS